MKVCCGLRFAWNRMVDRVKLSVYADMLLMGLPRKSLD